MIARICGNNSKISKNAKNLRLNYFRPRQEPGKCAGLFNCDFCSTDSSAHTPQVRIDDAVRAVEIVAKRQGLTSEHIDSLMQFVVGQRKGSE